MIVRELITKLGFNIDMSKFEEFKKMADNVKANVESLQQKFQVSLTPEVNAVFQQLKAYHDEVQGLTKEERADVLAMNRLEKQAIKEVAQAEREKHKEIKALEKEATQAEREKYKEMKALETDAMRQRRQNQQELVSMIKSIQRAGKAFTVFSASVSAGFMLSLKGTLKDVDNYKTQSGDGEKKTNSIFSGNQLKIVDDFNKSFEKTKDTITELRNSFVIEMLPTFKPIIDEFRAWVNINKEFIKQKFKSVILGIGSVISGVAKVVKYVTEAFGGWGQILNVVKVGLIATGIFKLSKTLFEVGAGVRFVLSSLGGFSITSLFSPITLMAAAFTGLLFVLDDLWVFSKGGKSMIGDIVNSEGWKEFKKTIDGITESINNLLESFGNFLGIQETLKYIDNNVLNATDGSRLAATKIADEKQWNPFRILFEAGKIVNENVSQPEFAENQGNVKQLQLPRYSPEEVLVQPSLPRYSPEEVWAQPSSVYKNSSFVQSPTFNQNISISLNVPKGTTQEQAASITTQIKKEVGEEVKKGIEYELEKWGIAVGST